MLGNISRNLHISKSKWVREEGAIFKKNSFIKFINMIKAYCIISKTWYKLKTLFS